MFRKKYPPEMNEAIVELMRQGLKAKEIAAEMQRRFAAEINAHGFLVTKNSVIGKVHRLGFTMTNRVVTNRHAAKGVAKKVMTKAARSARHLANIEAAEERRASYAAAAPPPPPPPPPPPIETAAALPVPLSAVTKSRRHNLTRLQAKKRGDDPGLPPTEPETLVAIVAAVSSPEAQEVQQEAPEAPEPWRAVGSIDLFALTRETCRWPVRDEPTYLFCGKETMAGSVYCAMHARKAGAGYVRRSGSFALPRSI